MVKIDFVPNDYTQQRQSSRANFMYLVLFMILMAAVGITFSILKLREQSVKSSLAAVDAKMMMAKGQIAQLEELQTKGKVMMKTMAMAAELLEPVPKSVVLACLTNNIPSGVSLLELNFTSKKTKASVPKPAASQYQAATSAANTEQDSFSHENLFETHIEIKGIAPSDIEVANYIAQLGGAALLTNVALVESKEHKMDETKFREFKLTAMLRTDIRLTKEDIESIRAKSKKTI
ncbi:MAG TPA: PilN domain-containing protein [Planctomycetes bacterium]|nr:PilN domain-containing protein [Planctomycetota bacterium]HIJ71617.1 PilN domain-containing protein [Planctomycetota bacterium]